jgi:hypothetical protein
MVLSNTAATFLPRAPPAEGMPPAVLVIAKFKCKLGIAAVSTCGLNQRHRQTGLSRTAILNRALLRSSSLFLKGFSWVDAVLVDVRLTYVRRNRI